LLDDKPPVVGDDKPFKNCTENNLEYEGLDINSSESDSSYESDSCSSEHTSGTQEDADSNLDFDDDMPFESDDSNILINYNGLEEFMSNFSCVWCRKTVSNLKRTSLLLATTISHTCECGKKSGICPELTSASQGEQYRKNSLKNYSINSRLVLLVYLVGGGYKSAIQIGALLNIFSHNFQKIWNEMEDLMYLPIKQLTDRIVHQNVLNEIEGAEVDPQSKLINILISGDGGWNQGGKNFNSISGHQTTIGKQTEKIIAFRNYSKVCSKCLSSKKN